MMRIAATLLALSLGAVGGANASPALAAEGAPARIETTSTNGLLLRNTAVVGAELRGQVCRAPSRTATGRVGIQLDGLDASGRLIQQSRLQLQTALGPADRACATFAIPVVGGKAFRLCADRVGGARCPSVAHRDS